MNDKLYIGRFVSATRNDNNEIFVGYRVSSRSFANRKIIKNGVSFSVVPINPDNYKDNPYISYNCLRNTSNKIIVSNGSHTDPITEKLENGYSVRDAISLSLLTLDYEKDKYNTPRIACVLDKKNDTVTFGIIKPEKLEVREIPLKKGDSCLLATYELTEPWYFKANSQNIKEFADFLYGMDFSHPVCVITACFNKEKIETGIKNP